MVGGLRPHFPLSPAIDFRGRPPGPPTIRQVAVRRTAPQDHHYATFPRFLGPPAHPHQPRNPSRSPPYVSSGFPEPQPLRRAEGHLGAEFCPRQGGPQVVPQAGKDTVTNRQPCRSRHNDHRTPRMPSQPPRHRPRHMVPPLPRRPYHQGIRAQFIRRRRQFPRRIAVPHDHPHVHVPAIAHLGKLAAHPAFCFRPRPRRTDDLAGQRLAVDTRSDMHDHQRPAQPPGHPGGIGQRVAARRRPVITDHDRVVQPRVRARPVRRSSLPCTRRRRGSGWPPRGEDSAWSMASRPSWVHGPLTGALPQRHAEVNQIIS